MSTPWFWTGQFTLQLLSILAGALLHLLKIAHAKNCRFYQTSPDCYHLSVQFMLEQGAILKLDIYQKY